MRLFDLKDFNYCTKPKTSIENPLGKVKFDLLLSGIKLPTFSSAFTNGKGDYLTGWYSNSFEAELLICSPSLCLPDNMYVEGCQAAVWRIVLHDKAFACDFYANWCNGFVWTDGGPNSGENLEAQTWESEEYEVSVGTQDGEMLQARAVNNELMPVEFNSCINPLALVKCTKTGLVVPIEQVFTNQICQIHFVVAWAPKKQDDVSTWYAVDVSHRNILKCLLV